MLLSLSYKALVKVDILYFQIQSSEELTLLSYVNVMCEVCEVCEVYQKHKLNTNAKHTLYKRFKRLISLKNRSHVY